MRDFCNVMLHTVPVWSYGPAAFACTPGVPANKSQ